MRRLFLILSLLLPVQCLSAALHWRKANSTPVSFLMTVRILSEPKQP